MKRLFVVAAAVMLAGCAMVQYNDGEHISIQGDGWYGLDHLQQVANKACQQAGKKEAVYIRSANVNPSLCAGCGVQNTFWQCK